VHEGRHLYAAAPSTRLAAKGVWSELCVGRVAQHRKLLVEGSRLIRLARDLPRLRDLRRTLASSPLTDAPALTRRLERVIRTAWCDTCNHRPKT